MVEKMVGEGEGEGEGVEEVRKGGRGDPPEREEQRREHRTALQYRRKVCWISLEFLDFFRFFILSSQSTLHTGGVVDLEDILHRARFASL